MSEDRTVQSATDQLLTGLRIAVTTICTAVLLTASLPRKLAVHDPLWPQVVAYGVLTAILLAEVVLLARGRSWSHWRTPALAAALGASALSTWSLPPEFVISATDWSFGTTGWVLLVLLSGRSVRLILLFLAIHACDTVVRAVVLGPSEPEFFLKVLAASVGTVGFPLAAGIATAVLRDVAERAHEASLEAAAIRTAEELAARVHDHRQQRFADIHDSAEPLLRGLAEGTLAVHDPQVRRACEFEAARMRRLFAETDLVADPLVHELRHGADVAERRGVIVQFDTVGSWPTPPWQTRRALAEGPLWLLSTARSNASITVVGAEGELSVHVLVDGDADHVPTPVLTDVEQQVLSEGEMIWMEVRWHTGT